MPNTTVTAPDGSNIDFPDSMSTQDITAAMQKLYPPKQQPGILARTANYLNKPLVSPEQVQSFVGATPDVMKKGEAEILHDIAMNHPIRAQIGEFEKGSIESGARMVSGMSTLPGIASQYLRGLPQVAASALFGGQGVKQAVQSGAGPSDVLRATAYGLHLTNTPPKASARQIENLLGGTGTAVMGVSGAVSGLQTINRRASVNPEATKQQATTNGKQIIQRILNEGLGKEKTQALEESNALLTRAKLETLDKNVKADASSLFPKVYQTVDSKFPEGAIDGEQVVKDIKTDLKRNIKAKALREKLPPSIQKIISEAEGPTNVKTAARLTQNELQTLDILYKEGLRGEKLRGSLVGYGYAPQQIDSMMQRAGEETPAKKWTFEQANQLRTELASDLFSGGMDSYPKPIPTVAQKTWTNLTTALNKAAGQAGAGEDWARGREKYSDYMTDFYGTYLRGKYVTSPLNQALQGDNATDIMEALAGKGAQKARDILIKYKQFADPSSDVIGDVRNYNSMQKMKRFSSPTKWDTLTLLMAITNPQYGIPAAMARFILPRLGQAYMSKGAPQTGRPITPVVPEGPSAKAP